MGRSKQDYPEVTTNCSDFGVVGLLAGCDPDMTPNLGHVEYYWDG